MRRLMIWSDGSKKSASGSPASAYWGFRAFYLRRRWRLKALEMASERRESDYQVSLGITLSEKDARELRQKLAKMVEEIAQLVKDSPSEKRMGFGLDFFEV